MRLLALAAGLGLVASSIAGACCGDGPVSGPRPALKLVEREPAGGAVEVLWLGRVDSAADAARVEAALRGVAGVVRVEVSRERSVCRVWFRDEPVSRPALVQAAAQAGHPASPLFLSRLLLPGAGGKGRLPPIEAALATVPGVLELEIEVEGADGLARIWHLPTLEAEPLRDAVARTGAQVETVPNNLVMSPRFLIR